MFLMNEYPIIKYPAKRFVCNGIGKIERRRRMKSLVTYYFHKVDSELEKVVIFTVNIPIPLIVKWRAHISATFILCDSQYYWALFVYIHVYLRFEIHQSIHKFGLWNIFDIWLLYGCDDKKETPHVSRDKTVFLSDRVTS